VPVDTTSDATVREGLGVIRERHDVPDVSLGMDYIATRVVLWGGWPFFQRGWASIINRISNMFTLIAIGTGAAYFYSVIALLFPSRFPEGFRGHGGGVALYFEAAAAVITTLVLVGQVLELRGRSQRSLPYSVTRPFR